MQLSLKYILALTASLSMAPLHAEMMQSSSLNSDVDGPNANLAARVLSKDTQSFNSRFPTLTVFQSLNVLAIKFVVKLSQLKLKSLKMSLQ